MEEVLKEIIKFIEGEFKSASFTYVPINIIEQQKINVNDFVQKLQKYYSVKTMTEGYLYITKLKKFKIGDRVLIVSSSFAMGSKFIGRIGEIINVTKEYLTIIFDGIQHEAYVYKEEDVKRIKKDAVEKKSVDVVKRDSPAEWVERLKGVINKKLKDIDDSKSKDRTIGFVKMEVALSNGMSLYQLYKELVADKRIKVLYNVNKNIEIYDNRDNENDANINKIVMNAVDNIETNKLEQVIIPTSIIKRFGMDLLKISHVILSKFKNFKNIDAIFDPFNQHVVVTKKSKKNDIYNKFSEDLVIVKKTIEDLVDGYKGEYLKNFKITGPYYKNKESKNMAMFLLGDELSIYSLYSFQKQFRKKLSEKLEKNKYMFMVERSEYVQKMEDWSTIVYFWIRKDYLNSQLKDTAPIKEDINDEHDIPTEFIIKSNDYKAIKQIDSVLSTMNINYDTYKKKDNTFFTVWADNNEKEKLKNVKWIHSITMKL